MSIDHDIHCFYVVHLFDKKRLPSHAKTCPHMHVLKIGNACERVNYIQADNTSDPCITYLQPAAIVSNDK